MREYSRARDFIEELRVLSVGEGIHHLAKLMADLTKAEEERMTARARAVELEAMLSTLAEKARRCMAGHEYLYVGSEKVECKENCRRCRLDRTLLAAEECVANAPARIQGE